MRNVYIFFVDFFLLQGGLKVSVEAILNGDADEGKELFELPVLIKADVQGSEQALQTALRSGRRA